MGAEVIVFITLFSVVFGIAYLYYSTRNKERLALIEKGADVKAKCNKDKTPLALAEARGHKEVVELLKKAGGE